MDPKSHAAIAYEKLTDMISAGRIKPGERLPTIPLAKEFGISRTPVMEALKRMEGEGIVVFRSGNGAWVIDPSPQEVRDVYVVRATLEALALELSFEGIDAPTRIALKQYVELEQEYFRMGDKIRSIQAGLDFHRSLAERCPNRYLVNCIRSAIAASAAYQLLLEPEGSAAGRRYPGEHERLLELVAAREKAQALQFLHEHILKSFEASFCPVSPICPA